MIGFYNYTVILTYMGVAAAIYGITSAVSGEPEIALLCLMFAGFCDMFDGTVAKTRTRTSQEKRFGIQIDSLADLICFGVLPAMIGYGFGMGEQPYHYAIMILYVLCALIRLAYFNVMEEDRQNETEGPREFYEGMPVTTVALLLPIVYSITLMLKGNMLIVYQSALFIIACLFVGKFHVKKFKMKGMLGLLIVGIIELVVFMKGM